MNKYRICKNRYNYYKIQIKCSKEVYENVVKWFSPLPVEYKRIWIDYTEYGEVKYFTDKSLAEEVINSLKQEEMKDHGSWECTGEY